MRLFFYLKKVNGGSFLEDYAILLTISSESQRNIKYPIYTYWSYAGTVMEGEDNGKKRKVATRIGDCHML